MSVGLRIAGTVGTCLSLYAMYVEYKHEEDPTYEAVCDINERMSCSRVLTSEWSHIISHLGVLPRGHPLDLANATLGLLYFSFVTLHRLLPVTSHCVSARIVFFVTLPVVAISVYLAYILFAVLQDICLLCMSIYGINLTVLLLSYRQSFPSAGAVGNQVSLVASKAGEAKSD